MSISNEHLILLECCKNIFLRENFDQINKILNSKKINYKYLLNLSLEHRVSPILYDVLINNSFIIHEFPQYFINCLSHRTLMTKKENCYERPITTVDGSGSSDGYFEVRHDDGSGTRFYDSTGYSVPRDRYQMYEDGTGGKWYAIHGEAAVERRPVYEDGMPVYDGDSVRSVSVKTVRYRNTPQRLGEPTERPTWDIKPPNRRRS